MSEKLALLLDDNLMSAARVRSQLERLCYRVQTARQVPNGIAPQLVIINLGSRALNGVTLIATCLELFSTARVLGFCGHAEIEIRRNAKQAGLNRILTNDEALTDLAKALGESPQDALETTR